MKPPAPKSIPVFPPNWKETLAETAQGVKAATRSSELLRLWEACRAAATSGKTSVRVSGDFCEETVAFLKEEGLTCKPYSWPCQYQNEGDSGLEISWDS